MTDTPLLQVRDLRVVQTDTGRQVVRGVSFNIEAGETVALVGESGSGKSLTARSLLGLLPDGLHATGSADWDGGCNLLKTTRRRMSRIRGREISLLLQDPFTSLNPLNTVGRQVGQTIEQSSESRTVRRSRRTALVEVQRRLQEVGIDAAAVTRYPFELSGGMRQRVGMAAAIAKDPKLLIADEPTTALDATTQREVLRLLRTIQEDRQMSLLLITHDLQVAFSMADRVIVMQSGLIVEAANAQDLQHSPQTEYAKALLGSALPLDRRMATLVKDSAPSTRLASDPSAMPAGSDDSLPILQVDSLTKTFCRDGRNEEPVYALRGIDVELRAGESLGVVGESGSGKTTLARCILGLENPTAGMIRTPNLDLSDYSNMSAADLTQARRTVQCVFQDPYSTLNPAHTIGFTLAEAIRHRGGKRVDKRDRLAEIKALLDDVGLPASYSDRLPRELSGGQRQRIAIARALALNPRLLICDEPVAALDLTVQAQILDLLRKVQERGVSIIFVTHDLAVARQMTDRLVVLYQGSIVERGATEQVIDYPEHEYTRKLLEAVPTGDATWLKARAEALS
jgi:peptide/nickel transport system ATP-binding protein